MVPIELLGHSKINPLAMREPGFSILFYSSGNNIMRPQILFTLIIHQQDLALNMSWEYMYIISCHPTKKEKTNPDKQG